jgi:hypothetical protein
MSLKVVMAVPRITTSFPCSDSPNDVVQPPSEFSFKRDLLAGDNCAGVPGFGNWCSEILLWLLRVAQLQGAGNIINLMPSSPEFECGYCAFRFSQSQLSRSLETAAALPFSRDIGTEVQQEE